MIQPKDCAGKGSFRLGIGIREVIHNGFEQGVDADIVFGNAAQDRKELAMMNRPGEGGEQPIRVDGIAPEVVIGQGFVFFGDPFGRVGILFGRNRGDRCRGHALVLGSIEHDKVG